MEEREEIVAVIVNEEGDDGDNQTTITATLTTITSTPQTLPSDSFLQEVIILFNNFISPVKKMNKSAFQALVNIHQASSPTIVRDIIKQTNIYDYNPVVEIEDLEKLTEGIIKRIPDFKEQEKVIFFLLYMILTSSKVGKLSQKLIVIVKNPYSMVINMSLGVIQPYVIRSTEYLINLETSTLVFLKENKSVSYSDAANARVLNNYLQLMNRRTQMSIENLDYLSECMNLGIEKEMNENSTKRIENMNQLATEKEKRNKNIEEVIEKIKNNLQPLNSKERKLESELNQISSSDYSTSSDTSRSQN